MQKEQIKAIFALPGRRKKCYVCGERFRPTKDKIYIAQEPQSLSDAMQGKLIRYSAMDCPQCGCQMTLAIRRREKTSENGGDAE